MFTRSSGCPVLLPTLPNAHSLVSNAPSALLQGSHTSLRQTNRLDLGKAVEGLFGSKQMNLGCDIPFGEQPYRYIGTR